MSFSTLVVFWLIFRLFLFLLCLRVSSPLSVAAADRWLSGASDHINNSAGHFHSLHAPLPNCPDGKRLREEELIFTPDYILFGCLSLSVSLPQPGAQQHCRAFIPDILENAGNFSQMLLVIVPWQLLLTHTDRHLLLSPAPLTPPTPYPTPHPSKKKENQPIDRHRQKSRHLAWHAHMGNPGEFQRKSEFSGNTLEKATREGRRDQMQDSTHQEGKRGRKGGGGGGGY